jgi:hypothetical protein
MPHPSPPSPIDTRGPLATALITLAGTPDDAPGIDVQLKGLVRLAADHVAAADYASVTARRGGDYTTVAASNELAHAVDEAQYAAEDGPCLRPLDDGTPITVPDISTTMIWPGFREAAIDLGLNASVSIPLFTGSGTTIATLNLYGRKTDTMASLIRGVWAIYDPARQMPDELGMCPLDAGAEDLLTGFAEALTIRATIQLAITVIIRRTRSTAEDAYANLRLRAADTGSSLLATAEGVITRGQFPHGTGTAL